MKTGDATVLRLRRGQNLPNWLGQWGRAGTASKMLGIEKMCIRDAQNDAGRGTVRTLLAANVASAPVGSRTLRDTKRLGNRKQAWARLAGSLRVVGASEGAQSVERLAKKG